MTPILLKNKPETDSHRNRLHVDRGLVLRRVKFKESDVRLTLFFQHYGKVLVVAKGGHNPHSKLKSLLEPFTEADFHFFLPSHGHSGRLLGGKLVDSHHPLRSDYDAFRMACRCSEVVEVLLPFRAASLEAFDALHWALFQLQNKVAADWVWIVFVLQLMRNLGHGDVSSGILNHLDEENQKKLINYFKLLSKNVDSKIFSISSESVSRCVAYTNHQLEQILPWRLKSGKI